MNTDEDTRGFVHFDEYEDAVVAVELVASQLVDIQKKPMQWKWVVIAMQNAMQGAMVIALAGTDGCGALSAKSQQLTRKWLQARTPEKPKEIMAEYGELLDRIQKPELMEGPIPKLSAKERRNLERLNELRRQFAHSTLQAGGSSLSTS